ncbi:MAG: NAD-dependent epimerase/dehydratase family protein [bacterium]|nr:NAD-dependent epimerase/dehydratase family protein [bacterium]
MKNVLISGCSGFLGSYLIDRLEAEGCFNIHGFTEVPDFSSDKVKSHHIDIRDRESVFRVVEAVKPDIVYHLAAVSNVGFSWKNQKLTYDINFIGSSNLLEAVSAFVPHCRVLLMSSAELYGGSGQEKILMDEGTPTESRNPYALSKKAMEMAAGLYKESEKMDIIILRSFNFTGPGQDKKFVASDFSYQVARIEKGLCEPVIRVGNLSAERDISDVRDIARYLTEIAEKGKAGSIYNLCSSQVFSIRELLDKLLTLSRKKIEVIVDQEKLRPVDVPWLGGNNGLLKEQLNLQPEYQIQQTLTDILDHWRERVGEPPQKNGR